MYDSAYGPLVERRARSPRVTTSASVAFSPPATLAGSALWLLSSNLVYAGCQWATVVAVAKVCGPASLGHLGLALAVATPVVLVTGFSLRAYQATDVLRRYAFAEYLNLRLLANAVAAAVIAAAAAVGAVNKAAVAILIPIGAAKLAEATSETCYGLAQRHDRMRFVAVSRMARGGFGLAALVAVVVLGGTLAAGAWALACAWIAFLFAVDLPAARALEPTRVRPRASTLGRLASESAPLGVVNGVFAMTQSLPRYLLQMSHGAAAVGYFTALASIVPTLTQLTSSVCHAAAPRLGWTASGDARRYRALVLRLLGAAAVVSTLLVVGAALAGRRFLTIAYAQDYAAYQTTFVLVVLAAGLGVANQVMYFALVAARKLRLQVATECLGFLVTGLAGAVLIPRFAVTGAAVAVALGAGATAIVNAWVVLRRRRPG